MKNYGKMQKSYTKVKLQNEKSNYKNSRIRDQGAKIRSQDTKGKGIVKGSADFNNHFNAKSYINDVNLAYLAKLKASSTKPALSISGKIC